MKLKVCGMRDEENIRRVASLQPDYMGFIFYEGSKRFVGKGFKIPTGLSLLTKRVGVFVNETTEEMMRIAEQHQLDYIQLHGSEPLEQCQKLKLKGLGIIKAFSIDETFDWTVLRSFSGAVDYYLFDAKGPGFGGNGFPFDWNLLGKYDQEVPFFLSGGLSPQNISKIRMLNDMNIHALDVNSGVE